MDNAAIYHHPMAQPVASHITAMAADTTAALDRQEASNSELRRRDARAETLGGMAIILGDRWNLLLCYNMYCPGISNGVAMNARSSSGADPVAARLDTAQALCETRGKRLTPIRRKVLEILLQQNRSVKAYELLELIRDVQQGAAPPTVYRALDFLVEEGLVHRLDAINAWAACHDAGGEPHDLLVVCTRCGAVAELSDPALSRRLADKVAQAGFRLSDHETELRALCRSCNTGQGDVCPKPPAVL